MLVDSSDHLEESVCPLCQSTARLQTRYRFPPFGVVRCRDCGLFYLFPRLSAAAALALYREASYYDERHASGYRDYQGQEPALRSTFRAFLGRLSELGMTGGDLLEVGCAYGYLLEEASAHFRRRVGVDFSPNALEHAALRADQVYLGDLSDVDPGPYDVVLAVQVIEHVYDPHAFLAQALARLRPGGWVVLATPDFRSPWRFLLQHRWPSFKIPEHVTFYDRHTLGRLLTQNGLSALRTLPYPHAFPLALLAAQFKFPVPSDLAGKSVWVPWTTLAMAGQKG